MPHTCLKAVNGLVPPLTKPVLGRYSHGPPINEVRLLTHARWPHASGRVSPAIMQPEWPTELLRLEFDSRNLEHYAEIDAVEAVGNEVVSKARYLPMLSRFGFR